MSYFVIHPSGQVEHLDQAPDIEAVRRHIGDVPGFDTPTRATTPGVPTVALWANDDFVRLSREGDLPRNPVGTALAIDIGARVQPYAGTIVLTGWDRDDEIVPLDPYDRAIATGVITACQRVAHVEPVLDSTAPELPPVLQLEIAERLMIAQGDWGRYVGPTFTDF